MATPPPPHLIPRKSPRQARAAATHGAILEATLHILLDGGPARLTTTRVAHRAGVSIGSLYQYFPHKQALLYALNARYLDRVADLVEHACLRQHGAPLGQMVDALVAAYADAKMDRPEVTRVLYRSIAELDIQSQVDAFMQRMDAATLTMFRTAPETCFVDLAMVNLTLLTAIFGTVRNVCERCLPVPEAKALHTQLTRMCLAYLESARIPSVSLSMSVTGDGHALPGKDRAIELPAG